MVERDLLVYEINFYESKITLFREMIDRYQKDIEQVKGELSSLDAEQEPGERSA